VTAGAGTGSLVARTVRRVTLRVLAVVLVATAVTYWHVRTDLEEQALDQLAAHIEERRARESAVFNMTSQHLTIFGTEYAKRWRALDATAAATRFDAMVEPHADGTLRLGRDSFERFGVTGIVGRQRASPPEVQRSLVAAFDTLVALGPAWRDRFRNLFVVTPEHAVLMYWPERAWGLEGSDWEVYGKLELAFGDGGDDVLVAGRGLRGTAGRLRWSELYFDYRAREWMITALRTTASGEARPLVAGHDLLLTDLLQRTGEGGDAGGAYEAIVTADGRLLAHPRYMLAIQAQARPLDLSAIDDPALRALADIAAAPGPQTIFRVEPTAEVVARTQLAGPGWWLLSVFPERLVSARALDTARWVLAFGVLALLAEVSILLWVLRAQVARPLQRLVGATREMAAGAFSTRVPADAGDEIGALGSAFNRMGDELAAREDRLKERAVELEAVNQELARQLEERRLAQRELERQREFHTLLNSIDYGVLILDARGRIRLFNRAVAQMQNAPPSFLDARPTFEELLERNRHLIVEGRADDTAWRAFVNDRARQIRRASADLDECPTTDGRTFRWQVIPLPRGERMLTFFELTALKRAQRELIAARERADAANQAKSAFVASLSHELRTPLTAISGYCELVLEELDTAAPPELRRDLERITEAAHQLLALINQVLDLAKIEAGHLEVTTEVVALLPLLESCLATVRPLLADKAVTLAADVADDCREAVTDREKLKQVLLNLLGNACKFTPSGHITVRAFRSGGQLAIAVADTGPGIAPEHQAAVFEEFRQLPATGGHVGSGLGLPISLRLAERLGGTITLASTAGAGATFTLLLPFATRRSAAA